MIGLYNVAYDRPMIHDTGTPPVLNWFLTSYSRYCIAKNGRNHIPIYIQINQLLTTKIGNCPHICPIYFLFNHYKIAG